MKIYNLTDHWFPDKLGGSCIYAHKLHRLLSQHVPTETITLIGEASPYERDIIVHKVLRKARFLENRRAIRKLDYGDAIWVVHSPWFFLQLFFALGFKVRRHVVGVYHGPWFREYYVSAAAKKNVLAKLVLSALRYLVELFYAMYVERFIFLSEKMYRATSKYLPISRSKIHIIPMWSGKNGWDPPSHDKRDRLVLSTFRRLEPRMGLQDLLAALKRCDLENYNLFICGDGPYKSELVKLIERLDLGNNVKLLGWVTEEEKLELIKESDAVIIPSRSLEGFSLLALESLELGTPVLLTEAVGFYEYVRDLEQDFVKRLDFKDATVAMHEFISKGSERGGLDRIEANFNLEKIGRSLLAAIVPGTRSPGQTGADRRFIEARGGG